MKMEDNRDSSQYIWRTVQDDKVRSSHAARAGETFSWTNPPEGGHPGEDFGCRCWAEIINAEATGLKQEITSSIKDAGSKWTEKDFTDHFYSGNGQTVTLSQTGYLGEIIEKAREVMFHRVEDQVADKMREIKSGKLIYTTESSYSRLGEVFWVFGGGTIRTKTEGIVTKDGDILLLQATVDYEYYDEFTDPGNIRQYTPFVGSSDPKKAYDWYVNLTDAGGTYFVITDRWKTRLTGSIKINKNG